MTGKSQSLFQPRAGCPRSHTPERMPTSTRKLAPQQVFPETAPFKNDVFLHDARSLPRTPTGTPGPSSLLTGRASWVGICLIHPKHERTRPPLVLTRSSTLKPVVLESGLRSILEESIHSGTPPLSGSWVGV